jgi:hypothetical protein
MKIEDIVRLHNQKLEKEAGQDPFLARRVKARLNAGFNTPRKSSLRASVRSVLVYGMMLIVFTVINFMLINGLDKRESESVNNVNNLPVAFNAVALESLEASYPGSISRAWEEVMK